MEPLKTYTAVATGLAKKQLVSTPPARKRRRRS
jgi:hypothetical protein